MGQIATGYYALGAGLAMGPGTGQRYQYVMDIEAANGTCGSCHCADLSFLFGDDPSDNQWTSTDWRKNDRRWTTWRIAMIEYFTSFAKTGRPYSLSGAPAWDPVDRTAKGTWGLPVLNLNL